MGCHCSVSSKKHSNIQHDDVMRPMKVQNGLIADENKRCCDKAHTQSNPITSNAGPSLESQLNVASGGKELNGCQCMTPDEYKKCMAKETSQLKELQSMYQQDRSEQNREAVRSKLLSIMNTRPVWKASEIAEAKKRVKEIEANRPSVYRRSSEVLKAEVDSLLDANPMFRSSTSGDHHQEQPLKIS